MFEILVAILTGVASTGIWEGGKIAVSFKNLISPLKSLYCLDPSRKVWIILSEVKSNDPTEFYKYVSPIDGVYSFGNLADYLRVMNVSRDRYDVRFPSEIARDMSSDNLILLGGYENNPYSAGLNNKHGRKFMFEDNTIRDLQDNRRWAAELDGDKRIRKDYCLITRMSNPYDQSALKTGPSSVVLFEGVRHFGTIGGVRFANSALTSKLRTNGFSVKKGKTLEIVVAFEIHYPAVGIAIGAIGPGEVVAGYEDGRKII